VQAQPEGAGDGLDLVEVDRIPAHPAAHVVGVLDGEDRGRRQVRIRRLVGGAHRGGVEAAITGQDRGLQPGERGQRARLEHPAMGVASDQDLFAGLAQRAQRDLVGHGAGGHQQRGLGAEQIGDPILQQPHRRILAVDVVTDLGGGDRRAHRGGRAGHRV
jgi:hypothetical protein